MNGNDEAKGTANARLFVSPLKNDAPSFAPPGAGALGLPAAPFAEHSAPFIVVDPDEIEGEPACEATLTPRAGTACTATEAFSEIDCGTNGSRSGASWPFALVLTPTPDYFTVCGASPAFDARSDHRRLARRLDAP